MPGVEEELGGGVDGGDRLEARGAGLPPARPAVGRRADPGVGQLVEQRRGRRTARRRGGRTTCTGCRRARRSRWRRRRSAGAGRGARRRRTRGRRRRGRRRRSGRGRAPCRSGWTRRAASPSASARRSGRSRRPGRAGRVAGSNGARTCSAPAWSQARRHGVTLASWSRRVPTTRSPGRSVAATARLNASVSVVMLAPNTIPAGLTAEQRGDRRRARSSSASQASAAANEPPVLALSPLAAHAAMASIAVSTICVPAGPSKRAHPSRTPGNRCRIATSLIPPSMPEPAPPEYVVPPE